MLSTENNSTTSKSTNNKSKKFFFFAIGFFILLAVIKNSKSGSGSFYGRYDLETRSSGMKEIADKYNAYIILNQNGTIVLHSEMPGFPVHRIGMFDEAPDKKTMTFIGTRFNDGQPPYSIKVKNGNLVIGQSTYSK